MLATVKHEQHFRYGLCDSLITITGLITAEYIKYEVHTMISIKLPNTAMYQDGSTHIKKVQFWLLEKLQNQSSNIFRGKHKSFGAGSFRAVSERGADFYLQYH